MKVVLVTDPPAGNQKLSEQSKFHICLKEVPYEE